MRCRLRKVTVRPAPVVVPGQPLLTSPWRTQPHSLRTAATKATRGPDHRPKRPSHPHLPVRRRAFFFTAEAPLLPLPVPTTSRSDPSSSPPLVIPTPTTTTKQLVSCFSPVPRSTPTPHIGITRVAPWQYK